MRFFTRHLARRALLLTTTFGAAWIIAMSVVYLEPDRVAPFVIEKLPVRFEQLWLFSLRAHVAAALVSLPLCIALMSRTVQRWTAGHRWLGRAAGVLILAVLVPSGSVLAFDAKGGPIVTVGFLLSGAIVAGCMAQGIRAARQRNLVMHRRMMLHVFAQMSVAVSSRAMLIGFDAIALDPELAYVVALWVPVLGSAVIAELCASSPRHSYERICRALIPFGRFARARLLAHPLGRVVR